MSDETLRQAAFWLVTATDVLDRWDRAHGYIINSERDALDGSVDGAWAALRTALAAFPDHTPDLDDDGMCPNCVTPWKCNGPHLAADAARPGLDADVLRETLRRLHFYSHDGWDADGPCLAPGGGDDLDTNTEAIAAEYDQVTAARL